MSANPAVEISFFVFHDPTSFNLLRSELPKSICFNVSTSSEVRSIWVKRSETIYAVLDDAFLFFCFLIRKLFLKNFQISFSVFDFGQRGRGECPKSKTPY